MNRFIVYLFPFILIAIEYAIRGAFKVDTGQFIGPTLASAGAGLLVPLTTLKNQAHRLTDAVRTELVRLRVSVFSNRDRVVSTTCQALLLAAIAVWVWALILAESKDTTTILWFNSPVALGLGTYFVGVVAAEVKEAA